MVSAFKISLVVVVVLFPVCSLGTNLTCISCDNETDCTDDKSVTCTGNNDHCLKIENCQGDKLKEKRCGTLEDCEKEWGSCYACKEDMCNSSSNLMPSYLVMGIVTAIVAKRYM